MMKLLFFRYFTVNKLKLILEQEKLSFDYVNQLTLLLRLRTLDNEIIKKLKDMPIIYDIEKDILYQKGMVKGKVEGKAEESKLNKAKREAEIDLSIIGLYKDGVAVKIIANGLKVSQYQVRKAIKEWKMKSSEN